MKKTSLKSKNHFASRFSSKISGVLGATTIDILYLLVLLSVTLICGEMVARTIGLLAQSALSNSAVFGGQNKDESIQLFILAGILFLGGHVLLSFSLNPRWLGIAGLLLPIPMLIGGYILVGVIGLIVLSLKDWAHAFDTAGSGLFYKMLDMMTEPILGFGIVFGMTAISVILFSGRRVSMLKIVGSGIGWMVGIIMSLILASVLRAVLNPDSLLKLPLPPTVAWVWLSIVFFSELFSKRTKWYGFIIWGAMMALAFLLALVFNRT